MKKSWRWAATRLPVKSRAAAAASGRGATGRGGRVHGIVPGVTIGTARGGTTARGEIGPGTGLAGTGGELSVLKGALGAKSIS